MLMRFPLFSNEEYENDAVPMDVDNIRTAVVQSDYLFGRASSLIVADPSAAVRREVLAAIASKFHLVVS